MTLFIIFHIVICVFLVGVILLQPGKADGGIGFGSSSQSVFGSKGASNFLTKTTSACALIFLATSFFLTRSRIREYTRSVIGKEPVSQSAPASPAPVTPKGATKGVPTPPDQVPTAPNKADMKAATNAKAPAAGKAPEPTKDAAANAKAPAAKK